MNQDLNKNDNIEYIYLLQEREFIKTKEDIFKVGKTKQENLKRFMNYPNGSKLLFQMICKNCDTLERDIINEFKNLFEHKKDIGNEYFEGNYNHMISIVYKKIIKQQKNYNSDSDSWTNDEFDSDFEEELEQTIDNYDDLIKNSRLNKIIITNKKTMEGFIKFDTSCWYIIAPNTDTRYDAETLKGWIEHNTHSRINYEKLSIDICKNIYNKTCEPYQLKYYEFFVNINSKDRCAILNTKIVNLQNMMNLLKTRCY
jgi:hypothetical protein